MEAAIGMVSPGNSLVREGWGRLCGTEVRGISWVGFARDMSGVCCTGFVLRGTGMGCAGYAGVVRDGPPPRNRPGRAAVFWGAPPPPLLLKITGTGKAMIYWID